MSAHDIRSAARPDPDQVLVDIADYVCSDAALSDLAYETAHYCLLDTLACGFQALDYPACTKLLGPVVPGATLPGGARVPGTSYELEPVMAAFNIGAMIRWLDFNDTWLAAEWGHPSDNLGAILPVAEYVSALNVEAGGAPLAVRLLMPSLNIRGLQGGGVGDEAANVIPTHATASIDIRLSPGNDPEELMDRVEAHIRAQGWHVVSEDPDLATRRSNPRVAKVTRKASYPGVRMPTDSPLADALLETAAIAAGEPVVAVPTFGGSVPLHHFTTILGAPIAITPFANHDNNQHAANENIRIANLWYGIDLMAALLTMEIADR